MVPLFCGWFYNASFKPYIEFSSVWKPSLESAWSYQELSKKRSSEMELSLPYQDCFHSWSTQRLPISGNWAKLAASRNREIQFIFGPWCGLASAENIMYVGSTSSQRSFSKSPSTTEKWVVVLSVGQEKKYKLENERRPHRNLKLFLKPKKFTLPWDQEVLKRRDNIVVKDCKGMVKQKEN